MKILNPINFITSIGADRWMGSGYKDAFEDLGHEVFWIQTADHIEKKIREVKPDIIFLGMERLKKSDVPVLNDFRKKGGKVVVFVNSVFDENSECFRVIKEDDVADIYRGETESAWMKDFEEKSGKKYFLTPNAAHERLHFPVSPVKKYECEIVFLGANLPLKKEMFERLLFPLQKNMI
jgi:spore maturation protein CgeB